MFNFYNLFYILQWIDNKSNLIYANRICDISRNKCTRILKYLKPSQSKATSKEAVKNGGKITRLHKVVRNQMEVKERRCEGQKETQNLRNFSFISGNGFQFFSAESMTRRPKWNVARHRWGIISVTLQETYNFYYRGCPGASSFH